MDMKEYMLEPDRISICTWIICWWTPFPIISLSKVQNSVEYVVNLFGGSTRVRLARSVVGVTSRALAVPLPDVYSPTHLLLDETIEMT